MIFQLKVLRQKEEKASKQPEEENVSPEEDNGPVDVPDEIFPKDTPLYSLGPCIQMFEEKQLLAVQMELKEKMAAEKRAIRSLEEAIIQRKRNIINERPYRESLDVEVRGHSFFCTV